jgi:ATP-dependent helicase/DNAse subunit B
VKGKIFAVPFSQQGVTQTLFQNVCDLAKERDFSSILYIASTPRKVKETRMQFSQWVKAEAFIPPQFFTIKDFAVKLYNTYGDKFVLPDFLKPVLIQTLMPTTGIGYAQRIANFIKEFKLYLYKNDPKSVQKEIANLLSGYEQTLKRIDEAFAIYKDYNQTLNNNGWIDSEDLMLNTPSLVKNLTDFNLILEGFFDLTPIEEEILKTLINQSKRTVALAYFDKDQVKAYEIPSRFFKFLQATGNFEIAPPPYSSPTCGGRRGGGEASAYNSRDVKYYAYASMEEEVEGIARQIKKRFIENNLDLAKTVVTFSQLAQYAPLVDRIFPKYGIPYTLIPKKNLKTSPLAIGILELLNAINEDFPRISTTITLTNHFFSAISKSTKNYASLFSKRAKITKGRDNWFYLQKRFKDYFEDDLSEIEKQTLTETEKGIRIFLNQTKGFDKNSAGMKDWVNALKDLLTNLGLFERSFADDPTLSYEYKLIIETLNQLQTLEINFGTKPYTLSEFIKLLDFLFDRKEYEPERKEQGVRVIDIKDTVGLDFENLFFGGLIEGRFPSRPAKDPILSEAVRKQLGLPDIDYHFKLQELDFSRLIHSTEKEPFLTYAQEEADQLLLPSPFLEGTPTSVESDNYLLSDEEVLRYYGQKENISLSNLIAEIDFSQDKVALDLLDQKYGGKNYFSVTELEKYRNCPFTFYIENILELSPEEEPMYEVDAMLWGSIAHKVFELLYKDGNPPVEQLEPKFLKVLDMVLQEEKFPRFWQEVARKIFARIIPEFIQIETDQRKSGFVPYLLERYLRHEINPGLRIKGRFDRIDRNGRLVRVLDYKTGSAYVSLKDITDYGTHLQLPLYAKMMQLERPRSIIDDIGIYSLRDMKIYWLVKGKNNLQDLVSAAVNFAQIAVGNIKQGKFPAQTLNEQDCRRCDYFALCPKQKTAGKNENDKE